MRIPLRCTGADDNLCEKITNNDCKNCDGCSSDNEYFEVNEYDDFFTITYYKKIGDLEIIRCSERITKQFNLL
jgi:hypothetical protein